MLRETGQQEPTADSSATAAEKAIAKLEEDKGRLEKKLAKIDHSLFNETIFRDTILLPAEKDSDLGPARPGSNPPTPTPRCSTPRPSSPRSDRARPPRSTPLDASVTVTLDL